VATTNHLLHPDISVRSVEVEIDDIPTNVHAGATFAYTLNGAEAEPADERHEYSVIGSGALRHLQSSSHCVGCILASTEVMRVNHHRTKNQAWEDVKNMTEITEEPAGIFALDDR